MSPRASMAGASRRFVLAFLLALVVLGVARPVHAQNQIMKGSLAGVITDSQRLAIPGVTVEITAMEGTGRWSLVTDAEGRYVQYGLAAGRYRVSATLSGFATFQSEPLTLRPGEDLSLAIQLAPAGLSEEVTVTPSVSERRTDYSSPSNVVTATEIASLNTPTVEDVLNYQPGVVVRRRYIGDTNGTIGMRGANMFQTARAMVFADGVPLHNPLQTRWNGAPRWSLVAPDEVESAEVVYGPFSAEYSGNAMGGVVKFNTRMPAHRQLRFDGNLFGQTYAYGGVDERLGGGRSTITYGDQVGRFSVSVMVNHLQNASQPQNFALHDSALPAATTQPVVSGPTRTVNYRGAPAILYGNEGRDEVRTDLFKLKLAHQHSDNWSSRWTVAYEDRRDRNVQAQDYVRDAGGQVIWGDGNNATPDAAIDGVAFNVQNAFFGVSDRSRASLFVAWDAKGVVAGDWLVQATASRFDILDDTAVDSNFNPADPRDDGSGVATVYTNTGWTTFDLKLRDPDFLSNPRLTFLTGYHVSGQGIGVAQYRSFDYHDQTLDRRTSNSGGQTTIQALFAQLGWRVRPDWEVTLGGRQEFWRSHDGFAENTSVSLTHDTRTRNAFSPKLSVGWEPADRLRVQYSVARAYRFPVVEELFDYQIRTYGRVLSNSELEPEIGLHHNLGVQRGIGDGHLEVNYFREDVRNTIFTQFQFVQGASIFSFLPIDKVRTNGLDIVFDQRRLARSPLDVQVNATFTNAVIVKHSLQPSLEGKVFPRMPKARIGLFGIYHLADRWLTSLGARYTSDQFADLDNGDTVDNVFGAMDGYLFLDYKLSYELPRGGRVSFGVDNLTNEKAFVFHPWPGRTFFAELSLDVLGSRP
ncbi:MAG: TonB-dependent receptor [Vicinamibacterales bacterium]